MERQARLLSLQQFAEGIPCIVEQDPGSTLSKIYFDISADGFEEGMLSFYEDYLTVSENPERLVDSRFTTSPDRAAGLHLLADRLRAAPSVQAVKGQVTGPFTMLTGIKDCEGRAGYFDETIRDMVIKGIALKAAWQTELLRDRSGKPVLLFIDEPALAGLGSSAFISVSSEEIRGMINDVVKAIHLAGGLAGIHVCANTDWGMLLDSEINILSFDAYGYFDRLAPLSKEINSFLDRQGIIAWGGVPTSKEENIQSETAASLSKLWDMQMDAISASGRSKADILRQTLITPSCGTGSLSPEMAQKVLRLTHDVAATLQQKFL
ncbi:MAG: hypothetical protein ACWGN1_05605 [Desulfobulbales bacterium]